MPPDALRPGAPPCGLYIRWSKPCPVAQSLQALRDAFRVVNASAYERNMHMVEWDVPDAPVEDLTAVAGLCAHNGIVFVLREAIGAGVACGADGVVVGDDALIPAAREAFGEDGVVGIRCGSSRERAIAARTANIDYVIFSATPPTLPSPSLAAWWSTQSDIPCVMEGALTNDDCALYVKNGASFIDGSSYILTHPAGIPQGTVDMLYAIDLALDEREKN